MTDSVFLDSLLLVGSLTFYPGITVSQDLTGSVFTHSYQPLTLEETEAQSTEEAASTLP